MKFSRYLTTRLYSSVPLRKIDYCDLLLKNLPLKTNDIDSIRPQQKEKLLEVPPKRIIKNCELIRNFNVDIHTVANIVACLRLNSTLIKHRIFLLQELGVSKLHVDSIVRLPIHMKISANDFKKKFNIPKEQNIMVNLLCHIDDKILDPPPLELLNESLPLYQHYEACLLYYTTREIGVNNLKILAFKGKKYKSFRLMSEVLKLFREELGADREYLKKHSWILNLCSDEIKNMLESLKDIKVGTMTIQEAIKKKPEISEYDPENIKKLLESLKKYEVDAKAVDNYLIGLKLRNSEFVKKMEHLLTVPDMKVWCKNSRILYFMLNEKVAKERIDYLRKAGFMKWASMFLFTSSKRHFKRFIEDDLSHRNKRTYVRYILCKELGYDKAHIIDMLARHPYWNKVPFTDMDHTLCSLKENFSAEDICSNIQLVLYPWSLISKILKYSQNSSERDQNYSKNQNLAYCLYLLEKNNHFTGDGIWNLQIEMNTSLIKEESISGGDISCRINENLGILNNTKSNTTHTYIKHNDIES